MGCVGRRVSQTRLNSLLLLLATAPAPASNPVLVTLVRALVMTSSGEVTSLPFVGVGGVSFLVATLESCRRRDVEGKFCYIFQLCCAKFVLCEFWIEVK